MGNTGSLPTINRIPLRVFTPRKEKSTPQLIESTMQTDTTTTTPPADSLLTSDYAAKSRRLLEASKTLRDLG